VPPASAACLHNVLEGNIHEFVLAEKSRRAVDELYGFIENLNFEIANTPGADPHIFMLVDASAGLPPLNYAFKHTQPLIAKYPMQKATVAMISPDTFLLTTTSAILRTITPVHFYKPHERAQALAWLYEQAAAKH
jgi:hypothetical protein